MGEGQLDSFPNFLLLHVQSTNIGICHVGLLILPEHGDGRVSLGRKDVYEGI